MLRHSVATLAYRAYRTFENAPTGFGDVRACAATRSAVQILAHMGDLFDWALSIARGKQVWKESTPMSWDEETARFFEALQRFDDYLASDSPLPCESEKLLQGPIADALTHVGQLAMLRRLAGSPMRGESYYKADIKMGCVGKEQAEPGLEFKS
jgi:hypothetical protein